jgi:phage major head subunit gpT-like protein
MHTLWILAVLALVAKFVFRQNVVASTGLNVSGLRSEFFERYNSLPDLAGQLATRVASTKDSETYKFLGSVPMMREWGKGRQAVGLRTESYSVPNLKYEATVEVDRDEIADDQTGQIRIRIQELAEYARSHKAYLIGQLLENGATSGFNSYDGTTFFSASHSSGDSGSQDNDLTSNITDPTNPTTAEFKEALKGAIAAMMAFKDDRGLPKAIAPSGLICIVPPLHYFAALEAVNATVISQTTNVLAGIASVMSFPWLTSTDRWYLVKTDSVIRPFVFQDREALEFAAVDQPADADVFKTDKLLYGVRARYRMTYGYWQYCVRHIFT